MNYELSAKISEEVKKAKRILINCHRGPDPDSIGSALALFNYFKSIGKEVEVVCGSLELYDNIKNLKGYELIKTGVDFANFDFSSFDLFIILDSSSLDQALGSGDINLEDINTVVIDHHIENIIPSPIKLLDEKVTSTGELLFLIFEDWGVSLDKTLADCLMAAIVGDTGAFRFRGLSSKSFRIIADLMDKGADKDKIVDSIYRTEDFSLLKFWGEVLKRLEVDVENRFSWSVIPNEVFVEYGSPLIGKETAASQFLSVIKDTDFGFVAVERVKNELGISFRSRTGVDTSVMARELGGGGHVYASGAKIKNLLLDEAVKKVLEVARKYAKKTS